MHVHYRYLINACILDISSMYVQYRYHIIACTLQVFYHYMYTTDIILLHLYYRYLIIASVWLESLTAGLCLIRAIPTVVVVVAVEGLSDTDTVGTLELPGLTGAARTVHHLVLTLHTVLDAITHQPYVDAGVAAGQFVGLAGKRVCRASSLR